MAYLEVVKECVPVLMGALLGLFFAYITIVSIWRIKSDAEEAELDPFKSRFGKTALAGLAGSVVADIVSNLMKSDPAVQPLILKSYVISFVIFFFIILFWFARANANLEADRAEIMFGRGRVIEVVRRDTCLNLIRGKNQMRTQELVDEVGTYQEMIESVCRRLCQAMKEMIRETAGQPDLDVRVSISVVSRGDQDEGKGEAASNNAQVTALRYVSRDEKSMDKKFQKKSVAWFAVMLGEPRWYLKGWKNSADNLLLDGDAGSVPESFRQALGQEFKKKVSFSEYWEERDQDYDAFLIIPVPLGKRYMEPVRCGAIHVSFQDAEKFKAVFGASIVEHAGFSKDTMHQFESQPLVKKLEAVSYSLVPLLRKYDFIKAQYYANKRSASA
ncbi:MAG TPA: hypothetical protein VII23_17255 [Terriglobales bacterium]